MSEQILIGAIIALFGIVTTLAGVAWKERGQRIADAVAEKAYYRADVPVMIDRIVNSVDAQKQSIDSLTRVAEDAMRSERSDRGRRE